MATGVPSGSDFKKSLQDDATSTRSSMGSVEREIEHIDLQWHTMTTSWCCNNECTNWKTSVSTWQRSSCFICMISINDLDNSVIRTDNLLHIVQVDVSIHCYCCSMVRVECA